MYLPSVGITGIPIKEEARKNAKINVRLTEVDKSNLIVFCINLHLNINYVLIVPCFYKKQEVLFKNSFKFGTNYDVMNIQITAF